MIARRMPTTTSWLVAQVRDFMSRMLRQALGARPSALPVAGVQVAIISRRAIASHDVDEDGVVALGTVGGDVFGPSGLERSGLVDRSDLDAVHPWFRVPFGLPLDPRLVGSGDREVAGKPLAVVDGNLDRLDTADR